MRILIAFLILAGSLSAQTVGIGAGIPSGEVYYTDNAGKPLAGGKVCTYQAGSSTPLATYSDSQLMSANTNPVVLNSAGRASIWLNYKSYKIVLRAVGADGTCSTGAVLWTQDNVTAPIPAVTGGVVNVLSYGAKCDGSTDDASAFSSALSAGYNVQVPGNRTCVIGSELTLSTTGQALIGAPGLILQSKTGYSGTLLTITGTSNTVSNITFDGNGQGSNGGILVYPSSAAQFQFLNNAIANTVKGQYPFRCDSCTNSLIQGNQLITGILGAGLVVFGSSNNVQVIGNTVINSATGPDASAFDVQGGSGGTAVLSNIVLSGNSAQTNTGFCYEAGNFGGSSASFISIVGNSCQITNTTGTNGCTNATTPRACGGISVPDALDSVIATNTINASGQHVDIAGIEVGTTRMTVTGNVIYGGLYTAGGSAGIQAYCDDCTITSNRVYSFSSNGGGIKYATVGDNAVIEDNTIVMVTSATGEIGIYMDCHTAMGSQYRPLISGNTIIGNGSNTGIELYHDNGTCTISDGQVTNNQLYNLSTGIQLSTALLTVVSGNHFGTVTTPLICSSCTYALTSTYNPQTIASLGINQTTTPTQKLDVSGTAWMGGNSCISNVTNGYPSDCKDTVNRDSPFWEWDAGDGAAFYRGRITMKAGGAAFRIDTVDGPPIQLTNGGTVMLQCYSGAAGCQLGAGTTLGGVTVKGDGQIFYCTDCGNTTDDAAVAGATCVGGGHGAIARRQNSKWACN